MRTIEDARLCPKCKRGHMSMWLDKTKAECSRCDHVLDLQWLREQMMAGYNRGMAERYMQFARTDSTLSKRV